MSIVCEVGHQDKLGNINLHITSRVYDEIIARLNKKTVTPVNWFTVGDKIYYSLKINKKDCMPSLFQQPYQTPMDIMVHFDPWENRKMSGYRASIFVYKLI
jgi:hypothetical protein